MENMFGLLFVVFFVGVLYILYGNEKKAQGKLREGEGFEYPYEIGNYLSIPDRKFAGMTVGLPKKFAHIYLDHRIGSRFAGPMRTYENDQQIDLEGDFDKSFQLLAPQSFQVLALSIMTPDVMQTLMRSASRYDVEIKGDRLNIIAGRSGMRFRDGRVDELVQVARAIVSEIDHKQRSWGKENEKKAAGTELRYYKEQSVRLFGKYVGIGVLTISASAVVAVVLFAVAYLAEQRGSEFGFLFRILGIAIFIMVSYMVWDSKHDDMDSE